MLATLLSRSLTSVDVWFRCTGVGMGRSIGAALGPMSVQLLEPISKPEVGSSNLSGRASQLMWSIPVR
jgi:hypothetical protein